MTMVIDARSTDPIVCPNVQRWADCGVSRLGLREAPDTSGLLDYSLQTQGELHVKQQIPRAREQLRIEGFPDCLMSEKKEDRLIAVTFWVATGRTCDLAGSIPTTGILNAHVKVCEPDLEANPEEVDPYLKWPRRSAKVRRLLREYSQTDNADR